MPRISAAGRAMRAEQTGGEKAEAASRMAREARADVSAARDRLEVLDPFKVSLPSTGLVASRTVLRLDKVTAGYASDAPILSDLSLTMTGPERLAVIGSNGTGKTTLLSVITSSLVPFSGSVRVEVSCAFLDQKVSLLQPRLSIRDNFMRLNAGASENACRRLSPASCFVAMPASGKWDNCRVGRCCAPAWPVSSVEKGRRNCLFSTNQPITSILTPSPPWRRGWLPMMVRFWWSAMTRLSSRPSALLGVFCLVRRSERNKSRASLGAAQFDRRSAGS